MGQTSIQVSRISAFHIQQKDLNQQFVFIADEQDVARRGLLFINLNYKGNLDAIRQKADAIGDFVGRELYDRGREEHGDAWSSHVIEQANSKLYPLRSFAIFADIHPMDRGIIASELSSALVCNNHASWMGQHSRFPSVLAQWESLTTRELTQHEQGRVEKDWNEHCYVFVGKRFLSNAEVEIVSIKSKRRWKWSFENFCGILHYLTIGLITEEQLSLPWKAQPELLRAISPDWMQSFKDDMFSDAEDDDDDEDDEYWSLMLPKDRHSRQIKPSVISSTAY